MMCFIAEKMQLSTQVTYSALGRRIYTRAQSHYSNRYAPEPLYNKDFDKVFK